MVEIIPPTVKINQEYEKERRALLGSPFLYSIRTIADMLVTGKEAKIITVARGLKSAMYADSIKSSMINVTPRTGE